MKMLLTLRRRWLLGLLAVVVLLRVLPGAGDMYSRHCYPFIANVLSGVSGCIPFSVSEVFYLLGILVLVFVPFYAHFHLSRSWKEVGVLELESVLWLYVWFYLAWGLNYSQSNFFQRTQTPVAQYDVKTLKRFSTDYLAKLNASYCTIDTKDDSLVRAEVVAFYRHISEKTGINAPFFLGPSVKTMLFSRFFSKVGVAGTMGPFFGESLVSNDLLPSGYAATWAHEYAHQLGIGNEGEANFYAYLACTSSRDSTIRFSGYFSILGYVLNTLYKEDPNLADDFVARLRPEVKQLYRAKVAHWRGLYSHTLGEMQNWIYERYLHSNNVEDGVKSYSQVVLLLISYHSKYGK